MPSARSRADTARGGATSRRATTRALHGRVTSRVRSVSRSVIALVRCVPRSRRPVPQSTTTMWSVAAVLAAVNRVAASREGDKPHIIIFSGNYIPIVPLLFRLKEARVTPGSDPAVTTERARLAGRGSDPSVALR